MTHIDKPVSSVHPMYSEDMSTAPHGRKLIALNPGGVACFAVITNSNVKDFIAWAPLPKRPKRPHLDVEELEAHELDDFAGAPSRWDKWWDDHHG